MVHLASKLHKNNVEIAKKTKMQSAEAAAPVFKRPCPSSAEILPVKKMKTDNLNNTQNVAPVIPALPAKTLTSCLKKRDSEEMETEPIPENTNNVTAKNSKKEKDSSLPEGFFDDPIMDAKVNFFIFENFLLILMF